MDDTTDIDFHHLDLIAADAKRSVDTGIITGAAAESVVNALAEFDAVRASVADHGADGHSNDFVISPPKLALQWLEYAAAQWAEHTTQS